MAHHDFGAIVLGGGAPGEHTAAGHVIIATEAFLHVPRDLDARVHTPIGAP